MKKTKDALILNYRVQSSNYEHKPESNFELLVPCADLRDNSGPGSDTGDGAGFRDGFFAARRMGGQYPRRECFGPAFDRTAAGWEAVPEVALPLHRHRQFPIPWHSKQG